VVLLALFCGKAPRAQAAAFVGTGNVAGTNLWGTPDNWNPAEVPNAVGAVTTFNTPGAARTAFVDGNYTVGEITFNNTGTFANQVQNNAATPTPSLTLDAASGSATINSIGTGPGTNTLGATMVWEDSVSANITGPLTISAAISGPGGFTKTGPGALRLTTNPKTYLGPTLFDTDSGRTSISAASALTNTV